MPGCAECAECSPIAFDKAFDVAHSDMSLSIGIGTYDYFGDGYTKWPAYIYPLGEDDPIDTYYL
jgi:hypothetical protein